MAIVVEHEKRKREILEKSFQLFIEDGYEDVTYQKIADKCGITRTTLYIYFKNKREIFLWSIKQLTQGIELELLSLIENQSLSSEECLRTMLNKIVDACESNKALFEVLLTYLLSLKKTGGDPGKRVRRRLVRLQHLISTVIIRGMKSGEFKKINVKTAYEMFYGLIQSAIFRLSVLDEKTIEDIRNTLSMAVDILVVKKN